MIKINEYIAVYNCIEKLWYIRNTENNDRLCAFTPSRSECVSTINHFIVTDALRSATQY